MPRISVGIENETPVEIHYEDHGGGRPVMLIHGYPLDVSSWERQERELLKTADNPAGVDGEVFDGIKAAIVKDRYAYLEDLFNDFYNVDVFGGSRISDRAWQASFVVAAGASPSATYACVDSWLTDFRGDLESVDVPTLVVHGTEDRILPIGATAERLPALIDDVRLVRIEGGPHNIAWTHPEEVNRALLEFLAE